MKREDNIIVEGVIWREMLRFFFPILFGTFFQILYNTVDAIVVGRWVGKEALGAVGGPTASLISCVVGFFLGLSSGAGVVVAQFYGADDNENTSKAVHTSMALALALGLAIGAVGYFFARPALQLIGTPEALMEYAVAYLRIFVGGSAVGMVYNMGASILRARGDSRRPFLLLGIGTLFNIAADYVFVVWFGWNVVGAAWATVLAQLIGAVGVCVCLARETGPCRLELRKFVLDGPTLRRVLAIGVPAGLQHSMYNIANVVVQSAINSFGVDVVAAWTIFGKADMLSWQVVSSFALTISTFSGQNFGARKYDRVKKSIRTGIGLAAIGSGSVTVLLLLGGRNFLAFFRADPEVTRICLKLISIMVPYYLIYVPIETLGGGIRGTGDSLMPTVIMALGICVTRIIWIKTTLHFWPIYEMVAWSFPVTWVITSSAFLIYYNWGNWLERSKKRAGHLA